MLLEYNGIAQVPQVSRRSLIMHDVHHLDGLIQLTAAAGIHAQPNSAHPCWCPTLTDTHICDLLIGVGSIWHPKTDEGWFHNYQGLALPLIARPELTGLCFPSDGT